MKIKRFLLDFQFFLVTSLFCNNPVIGHQKRAVPDPYRSFSNNINTCLFDSWATDDVLKDKVACDSQELCYGRYDGGKALFAVCYNTTTLIPEYTGNIVESGGTKGEADMITPPDLYDNGWKTDSGLVAAGTPVALSQDYEPYDQGGKFDNYSVTQNQFLSRGHLSPNGDFSKEHHENSFTYITTNIAPQWQPFNMGNWVVVETAVQKYANQKGRTLYVFTGTGGRARFNGKDIMLNNRVLTPKYYWKAVCDPKAKQSVIFVAENKPGEISKDRVAGCKNKPQTRKLGVVYCYSLQDAGLVPDYADFKLPPFTDEKCKPNARGTFLDTFINGLK